MMRVSFPGMTTPRRGAPRGVAMRHRAGGKTLFRLRPSRGGNGEGGRGSAALPMIDGHLWGGAPHFQPGAYLLDQRGLLFEGGRECLDFLLLLRVDRFLF